MQLTVLVDNTTQIDKYYLGEPGLSFYLEDGQNKILFDCGYSDVFLKNAEKMGIDLSDLSVLVFSHGHDDHTGGLSCLPQSKNPVKIIAHPDTFAAKQSGGINAGSALRAEQLADIYDMHLSVHPQKVSGHLLFLGEIPVSNDFEPRIQFGERQTPAGFEPDFVREDSALVYDTDDGIYIITGCSHAGICNIISYAKQISKKPVLGVIGGFHLKNVDMRVQKTIAFLEKENLHILCPCHCTSFAVKAAINEKIPVTEIGSGSRFNW